MKIFLTEIDDPFNDKKYVGPYIKALSIEEAQKIAYENELVLVGELHELIIDKEEKKHTLH
tara:strand:- start:131 stop:313 length:183 start_codon:yes stop_codon:yes gene_type:complete